LTVTLEPLKVNAVSNADWDASNLVALPAIDALHTASFALLAEIEVTNEELKLFKSDATEELNEVTLAALALNWVATELLKSPVVLATLALNAAIAALVQK
jgi:hypothetical protein